MLSVTENPSHTHRPPLERRNFTTIIQEFHRNQFIFIEKTQETGNFPMIQRGPTFVVKIVVVLEEYP